MIEKTLLDYGLFLESRNIPGTELYEVEAYSKPKNDRTAAQDGLLCVGSGNSPESACLMILESSLVPQTTLNQFVCDFLGVEPPQGEEI